MKTLNQNAFLIKKYCRLRSGKKPGETAEY